MTDEPMARESDAKPRELEAASFAEVLDALLADVPVPIQERLL